MKKYILLTLFFSSFSFLLFAQDAFIGGPEEVICQRDSIIYELFSQAENAQAIEWWFVSPSGSTPEIIWLDSNVIAVNFIDAGTYLLNVLYEQNGITATDSLFIYVGFEDFGEIVLEGCTTYNSASNCYQVCAGSSTTAISTDPNQTGQWLVTGAESVIDNGFSVDIVWGDAGFGSIEFVASCAQSKLCIQKLPNPEASFSADPGIVNDVLEVCTNQEIYFENTSQGGLSYEWVFGDGNSSDTYHANHRYDQPGTYTLILKANSVCECADEKVIEVNVLPAPAPTLDCVNSVCPESRQKYTATTDGCNNYNWVVSANGTVVNGGEATDDFIEIIWHEGPEGFIELSVSNCNVAYCSATNTFRVPIVSPDGPIEGDASVCSGEVTTYVAPYFLGTEYSWQISSNGVVVGGRNSNAISIQWREVSAAESATVSVSYDNCFLGCGGDDVFNINITPTISLSGDFTVCEGSDATINAMAGFALPTPVSVNWQIQTEDGTVLFDAGSASSSLTHTFSYAPGNYYWVALNADASYCNEEIKQLITIFKVPTQPLGIIGEDEICAGLPYGFTIDNSGPYNTIWTVTDGANTFNYEGATMTHTFGAATPYLVEAAHTDIQFKDCASAYISKPLESVSNLVINGPDEACNQSLQIYTIEEVGGASYDWQIIPANMGQIRLISPNEIEVFWSEAGNADVVLNICGSVITTPVMVHALPTFSLVGVMATCDNAPTTVSTNQSTLTHDWYDEAADFIATGNSINLTPGFYSVVVTDDNGCTSDTFFEIESLPAPKARISSADPNYFCGSVAGSELISSSNGIGYTYSWTLNGVEVGTDAKYTATDFGEYQLAVTNSYGCMDLSQIYRITECCTDCFPSSGGSGCPYLEYDFMPLVDRVSCEERNYSTTSPDLIAGTGRWQVRALGQGVIANYNSDIANHRYINPGYFAIVFKGEVNGFAYPDVSCFHFQYFVDTIRMVADFAYDKVCVNEPVDFTDLTTYLPDESIVSQTWDFGDPASGASNTSTDLNPTHIFSTNGIFTVTHTVQSASGCEAVIVKEVNVSKGPELVIDFNAIDCEDEAVAFSVDGNIFDVEWSFGDPTSANENMAYSKSVLHSFDDPDIYTVTVTATDIYGCTSQTTVTSDIKENTLSGNIQIDPSSTVCEGELVTLTAPAGGISWDWSNEETTVAITIGEADQYNVFMRDGNNCAYAAPAEYILVEPKPAVVIRGREVFDDGLYGPWQNAMEICDGMAFELRAFSTTPSSYVWGGGQTTQSLNFNQITFGYPAPGQHQYSVIATSIGSACPSDEVTFDLEIFELPNVPAIALTAGTGCSFNTNTLTVTNIQAGMTYLWSDGQSGTSIETSNAGNYSVAATNDKGCSEESNELTIMRAPAVDQIAGGCFLACDPLTVCLPTLNDVSSYTIYQNGTVFETGGALPSDYLITQDGSYTIELTSFNGCTATSLPLDVTLYTGVGTVTVLTYEDLDNDGMITAADQLLGDIGVQILSDDGLHKGMTETEGNGQFDFVDFPATGYEATIDRDLLSPQWKVVIDSVSTSISTCGDSISVSLLLVENCEVTGPPVAFELCPGEFISVGDSTWSDTGMYEVHFTSVAGCDSVVMVDLIFPTTFEFQANVWSDVDLDGTVSFGDTLVGGIAFTAIQSGSGTTTNYTSISTGPTINNLATDNYTLSLDLGALSSAYLPIISSFAIADDFCGTFEAEFLVEPQCAPITITDNQTICGGDSVLIGSNYEFEAGVYNIIVPSTTGGCDTTLTFTLDVLPEIVVTSMIDEICTTNGGALASITLEVMGAGPFTYIWSDQLGTDSIVFELPAGQYSVDIFDQNGCMYTDTFDIILTPPLQFSLDSIHFLEIGQSVTMNVTGDISEPGLSIEWSPSNDLSCSDCFNPTVTIVESQEYTAIITDANGCQYFLTTFVEVTGIEFFMPNIFSPNNDGTNDILKIRSWDEDARILDVKVISRWGNILHSESDVPITGQQGWDGRFKGDIMEPQVVMYIAKIQLSNGKTKEYSGDIFMLK